MKFISKVSKKNFYRLPNSSLSNCANKARFFMSMNKMLGKNRKFGQLRKKLV